MLRNLKKKKKNTNILIRELVNKSVTFWIKHRLFDKKTIISQHSLLWVLYTSSKICPVFLSLPKNNICQGPQNRQLFVRWFHHWGQISFCQAISISLQTRNSHSGLNLPYWADESNSWNFIMDTKHVCTLALSWQKITFFLTKCRCYFFKLSLNRSNKWA